MSKVVVIVVLLAIVLSVAFVIYTRKARVEDYKGYMRQNQVHLDAIEEQVAKGETAELQEHVAGLFAIGKNLDEFGLPYRIDDRDRQDYNYLLKQYADALRRLTRLLSQDAEKSLILNVVRAEKLAQKCQACHAKFRE